MIKLTPDERQELIHTIANREATTRELVKWYETTEEELKAFVVSHRLEIEMAAQSNVDNPGMDVVTPTQLDELWISNKFQRLLRLQEVADLAYDAIQRGGYGDSTLVREFRSYLMLAANELGQLLHRGSGEAGTGDTLSVHIEGVDPENLK